MSQKTEEIRIRVQHHSGALPKRRIIRLHCSVKFKKVGIFTESFIEYDCSGALALTPQICDVFCASAIITVRSLSASAWILALISAPSDLA